MIPAKAINAFQKFSVFYQKNAGNTILFGSDEGYKKKKKKSRKCAVCQLNHSIFQHNPIKEEYINPRWEFAKKQELCFRCLGSKL